MSDAILTFQVQLSGVMETVLKSAMYEITRLVEDSFLEEVARSKQEVESLRQRLQWSESRRREREGGGRARCADCGRAGVPSEDTEDRPSGAQSGVDEGRGLKQEKVPEGTWSSCPGEVSNSNPGPPSAPEELAPSSPVRAPDMSATAPTGLEGGRPDSLLKEEEDDEEEGGDEEEEEVPREMDTGDNIQGTWLPRSEAGGGAHVAPPSTGCSEQEWSPGTRQDTAPPSGRLLPEQQQSVGETYGLYGAESEHEHVAHRLSLAGPQRSATRRNDPHSEPGPWAEFKLGDIDNETDGLDPSYATEAEPASPSAQAEPQPAPAAEEGAGDSVSPLQYLNVKSEGGVGDSVAIKEEFEIQPVCTEEGRWDLAHTHHRRHRDTWDTGETQVESTAHSPPSQDAMKRLQTFSDKVESLTLQLRQRQQHGPPEKTPKTNVSEIAVESHFDARDANRGASWGQDLLIVSNNVQTHQRVCAAEKPFSCVQCRKSFTQRKNLQAHLKQHAGERPHRCTQCGKSFLYLSRLKIHLLSHTGERPFSCTHCEKSFLSLYDLKVHQRNHTGEKPYSCAQCGKCFTRLSILKEHRIIHSKEKSYCCMQCGKRFARPSNLKAHLRRHMVAKPHSCALCGKSFLYLCRLKKHQKKFHWTGAS